MIDREYVKVTSSIQTASNAGQLTYDQDGNIEATLDLRLPDNLFASNAAKKISKVELQTSRLRLSMQNTPILQMPMKDPSSLITDCELDVYPYVVKHIETQDIAVTDTLPNFGWKKQKDSLYPLVSDEGATKPFTDYSNHKFTVVIYYRKATGEESWITLAEVYEQITFYPFVKGYDLPTDNKYYNVIIGCMKKLGLLPHMYNLVLKRKYEGNDVVSNPHSIYDIGSITSTFEDAIENALTYANTATTRTMTISLIDTSYIPSTVTPDYDLQVQIAPGVNAVVVGTGVFPSVDANSTVSHINNAIKPLVSITDGSFSISYDTAPFLSVIPILNKESYIDDREIPEQITLDRLWSGTYAQENYPPPPKRQFRYSVTDGETSYSFKIKETPCAPFNIVANATTAETFKFLPWIKVNTSSIQQFELDSPKYHCIESWENKRPQHKTQTFTIEDRQNPEIDGIIYTFRLIKVEKKRPNESEPERFAFVIHFSCDSEAPSGFISWNDVKDVYWDVADVSDTTTAVCTYYPIERIVTDSGWSSWSPPADYEPYQVPDPQEYDSMTGNLGLNLVVTDVEKVYSETITPAYFVSPARYGLTTSNATYITSLPSIRINQNQILPVEQWPHAHIDQYEAECVPGTTPDFVYDVSEAIVDDRFPSGKRIEREYYWVVNAVDIPEQPEYKGFYFFIGIAYHAEGEREIVRWTSRYTTDTTYNETTQMLVTPHVSITDDSFYMLDTNLSNVNMSQPEVVNRPTTTLYTVEESTTISKRTRDVTTTQDEEESIYYKIPYPCSSNWSNSSLNPLNPLPAQPDPATSLYLPFFVATGYVNAWQKDAINVGTKLFDYDSFTPANIKKSKDASSHLSYSMKIGRFSLIFDVSIGEYYPYTPVREDNTIRSSSLVDVSSQEQSWSSPTSTTTVKTYETNDQVEEGTVVSDPVITRVEESVLPSNQGESQFIYIFETDAYEESTETSATRYSLSQKNGLYYPYGTSKPNATSFIPRPFKIFVLDEPYDHASTDPFYSYRYPVMFIWCVRNFTGPISTRVDDESIIKLKRVRKYGTYIDTESTKSVTTTITEYRPDALDAYIGNIRLNYSWSNVSTITISPIESIVLTLQGIQVVNQEYRPVNMTTTTGSSLTSTIPIIETYYALTQTLQDLHDELIVVKESFDDTATYTLQNTSGTERVIKISAKYITKDGRLHQLYIPPDGVFTVQLTFGISFYTTA